MGRVWSPFDQHPTQFAKDGGAKWVRKIRQAAMCERATAFHNKLIWELQPLLYQKIQSHRARNRRLPV